MITAILSHADDSTRRTLYLGISDANIRRLRAGKPMLVPGDRLASLGIGHGEVEIVIELLDDAEFTKMVDKARADGAELRRPGGPVS